jgi:hypothetical protein
MTSSQMRGQPVGQYELQAPCGVTCSGHTLSSHILASKISCCELPVKAHHRPKAVDDSMLAELVQ